MAEINPDDSVIAKVDSAFKKKVEELSGGKIKIDIFYSGILGDEKTVMDILKTPGGSIQLVRGPANLNSYSDGKPVKSSLLAIPYTFKNDEHFWKFASSKIAEGILNEPYEMGLGIKGLFFAQEGFRHYFSSQKIENLQDLKGKKMRVSGKMLSNLSKVFQSEPVQVDFTDLYAAFQTGLVDVAEQPISNYLSNSFYQVAPYLILDGHMIGAVSVMINANCWDSLSQKQKNVLIQAGKYAGDYCRQIVKEANELVLMILKSEGVTVTKVDDIKSWKAACSDIQNEASSVAPEVYRQILELAD